MPRKRRHFLNQDRRSRNAKRKRRAANVASAELEDNSEASFSTDVEHSYSSSHRSDVSIVQQSDLSRHRSDVSVLQHSYSSSHRSDVQSTDQSSFPLCRELSADAPPSSYAILSPQSQNHASSFEMVSSTLSLQPPSSLSFTSASTGATPNAASVASFPSPFVQLRTPTEENVTAPPLRDQSLRQFTPDQSNSDRPLIPPRTSTVEGVQTTNDDDNVKNAAIEHQPPRTLPNYPAFRYNPEGSFAGAAIGSMSVECVHCRAKKWALEPPSMCCANGKVGVPFLGFPPEPLQTLLTEDSPFGKEFRSKIRTYNSCFVMTSFSANTLVEPGFMHTYKVQGQIYHNIGPLNPGEGATPQFLQIYFIDDRGQQADARMSWHADREIQLNRHITLSLQDMLHENNEHIRVFRTALEQATPAMPDYRVVIHAERVPRGEHERTFNAPSGNDVAALIPEG